MYTENVRETTTSGRTASIHTCAKCHRMCLICIQHTAQHTVALLFLRLFPVSRHLYRDKDVCLVSAGCVFYMQCSARPNWTNKKICKRCFVWLFGLGFIKHILAHGTWVRSIWRMRECANAWMAAWPAYSRHITVVIIIDYLCRISECRVPFIPFFLLWFLATNSITRTINEMCVALFVRLNLNLTSRFDNAQSISGRKTVCVSACVWVRVCARWT